MRQLAKLHIWLGWLVAVPLLIWTISGVVMTIRPIEDVRGETLRIEQPKVPLPGYPVPLDNVIDAPADRPVELRALVQRGTPVIVARYGDGRMRRFTLDGAPLAPLSEVEARAAVAAEVEGGEAVEATRFFAADEVPFDFRREIDVWQVTLETGTRVYVSADTGEIAAVRTNWWRLFDFMWGLHIMDLETREDTSHPILIFFAVLGVAGSLMGTLLLFRRRKRRVTT